MQIKADKIKINTLIISDIHLGDESTRCDEIIAVLSKYQYNKLILNGDILDGLNLKRLHTGHWKVLSKLRKLSKTCEVIWVHGNHDAQIEILSRLLGLQVYNKYIWQEGDKKCLAIHGHQYDRFMNNNFIISNIAFGIYYLLKKYNTSDSLINMIKNNNKTWKRNSQEVAKGALFYARILGANYVFCGHTHIIDSSENHGIKYFNTGSWVEKPSGYIIIKDGEVELDKIT